MKIPYLAPISISFNVATILKNVLQFSHHEKEDLTENIILTLSKLTGLYFHFGTIILATTYLEVYGLISPILIWITNVFILIINGRDRVVFRGLISTILPIRESKQHVICKELMKTFYHMMNLSACCLIINTKYEVLPFKYGEWTIWSNKQVNLVILSLVITGIMSFVCTLISNYDRWAECTLNLINLLIIYFVTYNVIIMKEATINAVYVGFNKAENHTISIKAIDVTDEKVRRDGTFFLAISRIFIASTQFFFQVGSIPCSAELKSLNTIKAVQRNPWQRTALKLENLTDLQKFETWESVSVILLKQSSPYLPASPKITIKSKKRVLQITQEDWNKV